MRCLVLASQYKNATVTFATLDLEGNINDKILHSGYNVEILNASKPSILIKLTKKLNVDLLIIDNYKIDFKYEKKLKLALKVTLLVLDDIYKKHYCDILLNHNIYAKKNMYRNLVPDFCKLRCGEQYTLLRNEFIEEKKFSIFVAMGGTDSRNMNIKILKILTKVKNINVHLFTTTANPRLDKLKKYVKKKNFITLHINSREVAKIISLSDFSIISASVILNEVFYMETPFIAIYTEENQKYMYKFLKKNNYAVCKNLTEKKLLKAMR